ncbi:MAG TPA: AMP-binding protein [Streptosporangiaceae bacterium]|nr:AMP-binding protein [Streptosporangiaceae bacterium]
MLTVDDLTAEVSATRRLVYAAADRADLIAFVGGARHDGGPGGESYSYASFASTVQAAAAGLTWRGLRPRDVVGVMVPDAVSFAIAVHAIRAAGGVPSPVNAALCAVETAGQLAESGARMVLTSPPLAEVALAAADRSWVRQVFSFADAAGTTRFSDLLGLDMIRPSRGRPEDIALLPFSRGQDDRLRPVPVTHREYIEALERSAAAAAITGHDLVLAMPPAGDGLEYTTLLDSALLCGATVVAVRRQEVAMAAIAHQGTVAIVPRSAVAVVPDKVRVLAVS